ncbi:alkaline phosphatase D family protein [Solirubrobacter ginsenosidimutans]|uniref:Alkaline phosphatase D family protein n=1 Tax=Solirubrobacter ginsenosidimutans TaxID=490573 RepID=A0A9X3N3L4_9ACTN|nr:alkaline phosphatase D family protein [Solirubrobacter ginsenosidimutans]MDA0166370.1 alkaline phosphatase D family protein [Solirubrobacter ginsenosidimutans]
MASQYPFAKARTAPMRFVGDPFQLGVASGDPSTDGMVLWTRLAPAPLSPGGGMPDKAVAVKWEVAKDEAFKQIVATGEEQAVASEAHSVHAEPRGLQPGSEYFYRFTAGGAQSPIGRTKTTTAGPLSSMKFAFASCQQYEHGYYTAYKHMANEDLDLILHLGDYIYEYSTNSYTAGGGGNVRGHSNHEVMELADYRERHAQYKTDVNLQAAHASAPWFVTFDDHEVDDNWAGIAPGDGSPPKSYTNRKAAAFQAYWEHMPLRRAAKPNGAAIPIYRRGAFGDLATFHVLDTRQFRSDQPCNDGIKACSDRSSDALTMTGNAQEAWLLDGLEKSTAKWQIFAQQVVMAQMDWSVGANETWNVDAWDGYTAERTRLFNYINQKGTLNPLVLTGDIHQHWAADLLADFRDPNSKILGSELVGTSISTGADGSDNPNDAKLAENPWFKFVNSQRGYVTVELGQDQAKADFKVLPYVRRPGAPISTRKSFVIEAGHPGLQNA